MVVSLSFISLGFAQSRELEERTAQSRRQLENLIEENTSCEISRQSKHHYTAAVVESSCLAARNSTVAQFVTSRWLDKLRIFEKKL